MRSRTDLDVLDGLRLDQRYMEAARDLAPTVRAEAQSVEKQGNLTETILDGLREAKLYWLAVPTELGGGGADIVTGLRVVQELSRADGSVGWSLMANMTAVTNACGFLPPVAVERMFCDGPPIVAGMLAPKGTALPSDGGFIISGKFQFGSGISHADWVGGGVFVRENGRVRQTSEGGPDIRAFYVPRAGVRLMGNWDVLGLSGTGSFDYEILEQEVEEWSGYSLPDPQPTRSEPSFQLGFLPLGSLGHGAVALGVTLRTLEELAVIVHAKRRAGVPGIVDQQLFLHDFARKEASLQAARCFYFDTVVAALTTAQRNGSTSAAQQGRLMQANTYATVVSADVVRWCYTWASSQSLRNPSPLGRCLRDISAATQHVLVDPNTLVKMAPGLVDDWRRTAPGEWS